jgi:flagellar hook protein FlgE
VDLIAVRQAYAANAAVVRTADAMAGEGLSRRA